MLWLTINKKSSKIILLFTHPTHRTNKSLEAKLKVFTNNVLSVAAAAGVLHSSIAGLQSLKWDDNVNTFIIPSGFRIRLQWIVFRVVCLVLIHMMMWNKLFNWRVDKTLTKQPSKKIIINKLILCCSVLVSIPSLFHPFLHLLSPLSLSYDTVFAAARLICSLISPPPDVCLTASQPPASQVFSAFCSIHLFVCVAGCVCVCVSVRVCVYSVACDMIRWWRYKEMNEENEWNGNKWKWNEMW